MKLVLTVIALSELQQAASMAASQLAPTRSNATCGCHGPTWIEIDDGPSGIGGHCYDKLCIDNKEAHWQNPLSDCAARGAQKPFCDAKHNYCCTSCSAGGCSAFYSPTDVGRPYACSQDERIVAIPNHGQTCAANSEVLEKAVAAIDDFCCTVCSAGGCSAFYSPTDVGRPYACSKGERIVTIPNHGQTCAANSTVEAA